MMRLHRKLGECASYTFAKGYVCYRMVAFETRG